MEARPLPSLQYDKKALSEAIKVLISVFELVKLLERQASQFPKAALKWLSDTHNAASLPSFSATRRAWSVPDIG